MDLLLTIIGVLALGALLISAYVFAASAKRHLHGEHVCVDRVAMDASELGRRSQTRVAPGHNAGGEPPSAINASRNQRRRAEDRRRGDAVTWPLVTTEYSVPADRRGGRDRRRA